MTSRAGETLVMPNATSVLDPRAFGFELQDVTSARCAQTLRPSGAREADAAHESVRLDWGGIQRSVGRKVRIAF